MSSRTLVSYRMHKPVQDFVMLAGAEIVDAVRSTSGLIYIMALVDKRQQTTERRRFEAMSDHLLRPFKRHVRSFAVTDEDALHLVETDAT